VQIEGDVMFLMDATTIIIISVVAGVALLGSLCSTFVILKRRNKTPKIKIDEEFINNIITLYGDKNNISNVSTDNGRLKIEVKDLDIVKLNELKEISTNGVFVTGNTIKTLFRHDSDLIKRELEKRL
jgi:phosphotransferase system IIB component